MENHKMKRHVEETIVIKENVDGEDNWFYLNKAYNEWTHLVSCWNATKEKYFEYVKNKNVVVTAGGHVGLYVRFYSKVFKTVYAFEPEPLHFYCMVNNCDTDNVVKIQAGLSDTNKLVKMSGVSPMSLQIQENDPEAYIPTFTIDSLALKECDLIQLDIENNEYRALKGAVDTIQMFHPVLILENGNTPEIVKFLEGFNYKKVYTVQYDDIWVHNEKA